MVMYVILMAIAAITVPYLEVPKEVQSELQRGYCLNLGLPAHNCDYNHVKERTTPDARHEPPEENPDLKKVPDDTLGPRQQ
jgi:hypothetical protein